MADHGEAVSVEVMDGHVSDAWGWMLKACLGRIHADEAQGAIDDAPRLADAVATCHGSRPSPSHSLREAGILVRPLTEFEWPRAFQDVPDVDGSELSSVAP